jgi:hypothetical protein
MKPFLNFKIIGNINFILSQHRPAIDTLSPQMSQISPKIAAPVCGNLAPAYSVVGGTIAANPTHR